MGDIEEVMDKSKDLEQEDNSELSKKLKHCHSSQSRKNSKRKRKHKKSLDWPAVDVKIDDLNKRAIGFFLRELPSCLDQLSGRLVSFRIKKSKNGKEGKTESKLLKKYPKRSTPRVRYTEEAVSSDDDYFFCGECGRQYEERCPKHGPFVHIRDREIPVGLPDRAWNTLPHFMSICNSGIKGAGLGVWTEIDLPKGLLFGPYEGAIVKTYKEVKNSGYAWKIRRNGSTHYVEAFDASVSNWLRFINCAPHEGRQNMVAFQYAGNIYYRTYKNIRAYTELLVWYGDDFGIDLGILENKKAHTGKDETKHMECMKNFLSPFPVENRRDIVETSPKNLSGHAENAGNRKPEKQKKSIVRMSHSTVKKQLTVTKRKNFKNIDLDKLKPKFTKKEKYSVLNAYAVRDTEFTEISGDAKSKGRNSVRRNVSLKNEKKIDRGDTISDEDVDGNLSTTEHEAIQTNKNCNKAVQVQRKKRKCDQCSYSTTNVTNLRIHIEAVHCNMKPYQCPYCDRKTSRPGHLKTHIDTAHIGTKPHKCPQCYHRAHRLDDMKKHIDIIHDGKKPFKCPHCDHRATQSGNLKMHIDTVHDGKKHLKCTRCSYSSYRAYDLKIHISAKHDKLKPHKCKHCDYRTGYLNALRNHTKIRHAGDAVR